MQNNSLAVEEPEERAKTFVEGLDFYFEDGLMVLTRRFLLNRGYCCENECRHCPYEKVNGKLLQ